MLFKETSSEELTNLFMNNNVYESRKEQLLNEAWYQAQNLSGRDSKLLAQLSTDNVAAITKTIAALQDLEKNLGIYKECLVDAINVEAECADLASKYANTNSQYQNSYGLPGVVSTPKSYDIDSIKKDSQRMTDIQGERQKITNQKETYLRLCKADVKVFIESWKALNYQNAYWNEYIVSLNDSINQNY